MKCAIILLALTCGALSSPIEDEAVKEFIAGNHAFSARVYKEIAKFNHGNVIVSPISAQTVLSMAHEGSRGLTSTELVSGLHLPSTPQKVQYAFKHFVPKLMRDEDHVKMLSANKMYLAESFHVESNFRDVCEVVYHSGVESLDFAVNVDAARAINKWVLEHTNNKIRNLVKAADYDDDTMMVLVNALYFSGEWVHKFDRYVTDKLSFYQYEGDSVEVDTMHQTGVFNYYDDPVAKAQFLELPYKGGDIKMVIVLPHENQHISKVEEIIDQLLQPHPFKKEKVAIDLPKFKYDGETKFVPILENIGIKKAFGRGADFSGISLESRLFISDVIQKAHISLNEAGTEAAASTAATGSTTSLDPRQPIPFQANRPFIYYITYEGIITFIGRISHFSIQ